MLECTRFAGHKPIDCVFKLPVKICGGTASRQAPYPGGAGKESVKICEGAASLNDLKFL